MIQMALLATNLINPSAITFDPTESFQIFLKNEIKNDINEGP